MLLCNCFAEVLDCFLKASTSSDLVPLLPNSWCCIFFTCISITEPFGSANAYLLLLEAHTPFLCFMFCIALSIPLELGSGSLQICYANCYPFLTRIPPVTSMGGHPGSCPSFVRVLPITGMGGRPGRCPFGFRVLPIMGMGGRPGRCPSLITVLPITTARRAALCLSGFSQYLVRAASLLFSLFRR